jgi:DNA-binding HxlR family transcriptional regulator
MMALRKLGNRWTLLVLREPLGGHRRFSELRKTIPQVSTKSVARVLAKLEKDGLVRRTVNAERPPHVCYSLIRNDPILREVVNAFLGMEHGGKFPTFDARQNTRQYLSTNSHP